MEKKNDELYDRQGVDAIVQEFDIFKANPLDQLANVLSLLKIS